MLLRTLLLLTLGTAAGGVFAGTANEPAAVADEIRTLTVAELERLLDRGAAIHVYDANVRDSYIEGHIPGARWIRHDAVKRGDLPPTTGAALVFYCYNPLCGASRIAAERARSLGYSDVWHLPEGIVGWRVAGLPVVVGPGAGKAYARKIDHVDS